MYTCWYMILYFQSNATINHRVNRHISNEGNWGNISSRKYRNKRSDIIGTHRIWRGRLRRSLHGRENDKFCRNVRDITVTFSAAARELRDTGLILMQRRLIYAAAPFRTATLKTLTAFNFRWPSILFSLVWTTFSRTGYPAPLRHAPHASAKEITCPLPPLRRIRRCSFRTPLSPSSLHGPSPALSLRLSLIYILAQFDIYHVLLDNVRKREPFSPRSANEFESFRLQKTDTRFRYQFHFKYDKCLCPYVEFEQRRTSRASIM